MSSVLDSVEHGLLFCELVWSSRGVLPHVSTHTRTVGFLFEIESLAVAHTTNRPILGPSFAAEAGKAMAAKAAKMMNKLHSILRMFEY